MVGLSARGWDDLPERLRAPIQYAEVLLGSPRHLDLIPPFPSQQRLPWPAPLREGLPTLLSQVSGRRVVALASGDPLLAGIGSTLIEVLGSAAVRIHPAVSSVALARARMGWPERVNAAGKASRCRRGCGPALPVPWPTLDHFVPGRREPGRRSRSCSPTRVMAIA